MISTESKWDGIYAQSSLENLRPAAVLSEHAFLLPEKGRALDLACGLGANALLLAKTGLETFALDISSVALEKLRQQALQQGLEIHCRQQDVEREPLEEDRFDVIVVSRFLDRNLAGGIMAALKDDGLLFYQTFSKDKISEAPPNNPDYLLGRNELLRLFSPLTTLFYQEYSRCGNLGCGNRNEALYIAQKQMRKL